jgi:hypothetical protein
MKKVIVAVAAAALLALPGTALAKGHAPADGQCVAKGVTLFGGPTIAAVAQAGLVSFVITDHAFNNANGTEEFLGLPQGTICGSS